MGKDIPRKIVSTNGIEAHPARGVSRGRAKLVDTSQLDWLAGRPNDWPRILRWALGGAIAALITAWLIPTCLALVEDICSMPYHQVDASHFLKSSHHTFVDSHVVKGTFWGPVSSLDIHKVYRSHSTKQYPVTRVNEHIETPALSAICNDSPSGLIKHESEGNLLLTLSSLVNDGTPKHAHYLLDCLHSPDEDGWIETKLSMGILAIKTFDIDIEIFEPRGICDWQLPLGITVRSMGQDHWRIRATLHRLAADPAPLVLRWKLSSNELFSRNSQTKIHTILRLGDWGWLVQLAGIPYGEQPCSLNLMSRKAPLRKSSERNRLLGWLQPLNTQGQKQTKRLVATTKDTQILELSPDTEVLSRLETAANTAQICDRTKTQTASYYSPLTSTNRWRLPPPVATLHRPAICTVITPDVRRCRNRANNRANNRACFANLKTIAGSVEMYNLDYCESFGTEKTTPHRIRSGISTSLFSPLPDYDCQTIHWHNLVTTMQKPAQYVHFSEIAQRLKEEGYLQTIPSDPGFGENSTKHYLFVHGRAFCCKHGFIIVPKGCEYGTPPREQLLAIGISDPTLLQMASPESVVHNSSIRNGGKESLLTLELHILPLLFLIPFLWSRGHWRNGFRNVAAAVSTYVVVVTLVGSLYFQPTSTAIISMSISIIVVTLGVEALLFVRRMLQTKDLRSVLVPPVCGEKRNAL